MLACINGVLMALAANESAHPRSNRRVPGDLEIEFYTGVRQELSLKLCSSGDAASLGNACKIRPAPCAWHTVQPRFLMVCKLYAY